MCDLRFASEAEVAAFEQRVLRADTSLWDRFWTTPPLFPRQAVFEMLEAVYQAKRAAIDNWITAQLELANPRVVGPISYGSPSQRTTYSDPKDGAT
jgi:hypothetical protein